MRRFFLLLLFPVAAYALPVGNPADASLLYDGVFYAGYAYDPCEARACWRDALSFRIGYWGNFVFNRKLQVDQYENKSDIETTRVNTNAGLLVLNGWEKFDLFGTLGATKINIDTNVSSLSGIMGLNGARLEIESETAFSWSIGARGTLWECGCTMVGVEMQYFYTQPHITRVTTGAFVPQLSVFPRSDIYFKYREWQAGAGISHRFMISCSGFSLVPYIAVKWARAMLDADHVLIDFSPAPDMVTIDNMRTKRGWGYAVGVTLIDCDKMSLTVEGRFPDEKAFFASGEIRF